MIYVYECSLGHSKEVKHSIHEDPLIQCNVCGSVMHRVPQPFTFYMNPFETMTDRMTDEFGAWRHKGRQGVDEYRKKKGEIV